MLATARGCEFDVERGPDWLLVKVVGLGGNAEDPPPLADSVWALLQQHFTYRVVLELNEVGLLNSHMVGQLIALYRRICEHDGLMRLCGLSAYNRQVLHTCRLDDRLLNYEDRQDAVMAGQRAVRPR